MQTVEEFLLDNAATRSPEELRRLVDHFVAIADPDATDKAHRAASDREYLNLDRTTDGYHVAGFITLEHGQYVRTALEAIMGKPAADETRTSSQRRAQALSDLAHTALDQGKVGTSGSVRPHLGVLISYPEFLDLINTTQAAADQTTDGAGDKAPAAAPGGSASDPAPVAAPEPVTEPLPGLDTITGPADDPAERGPRSNSATDREAAPANEPRASAQAPTPASTLTGAATDPAQRNPRSGTSTTADQEAAPANEPRASTQAPTPESTSAATGLPDCKSQAVGPLGQPATGTNGTGLPSNGTGTALPGTDSTALPGSDVTALPGTDSTALPGSDGTALPGTAVTALPGTDSTALPGSDGTALPETAAPSTGRDWAALLAAGPATFIDNTGPVPRDLLDRIIGCAGETYRIIFGPDNEILNHGRAHRLFTAAQRRAVIARDRHCVYHDCTAPPEHCETHHGTRDWADGGNTDLHDAALVCRYHHHLIHTHNITMIRRNGTWHFYRPDGTEILPTRNPWN
ncbi:hypothetical protein HALOF300_04314 [Occultella aeris]|uniref:DUF222 domain-containing protein n=1 Tax=Occultella aeris TaxID=2761496 RepID=A0A7M4DQ76_9MICO|nr:hypothetical protein HALOF300_04314 [Occultella aeris]